MSATEKPSGSHPPTIPRLTTKPPNTFIIVCPAIIFANNLTERLIGLLKYEIISMITIKGSKNTKQNHEIIHKGIAHRSFEQRFKLQQLIEVKEATLKDGILSIKLLKKPPKEKKPINIIINEG